MVSGLNMLLMGIDESHNQSTGRRMPWSEPHTSLARETVLSVGHPTT